MPMFYRTVFLGHDLALFLPDPNWRWSLEITHRLVAEVEAGQTGRENRRPKHYALRHELAATWTLPKAQTAELENALWNLGTPAEGCERVYVGLPIFVDQLVPGRWPEKIYDAQWVLNYDETGYAIHASDDLPDAPVRRWFAPLIVGRLQQRPKLKALSDERAQYALRLLERSPWDFRIAPAPELVEVIGADWPPSLEANWKELPEEWTEDVLVYDDVGGGRVEALDGQEGNVRRAQSFLVTMKTRAQVRVLLNFFLARKGIVQSFGAPWLLQPGDDLPQTPHTTKARFSENAVKLTFTSDQAAEAKIAMLQVPWEIAGVEGENPEQAPDAYFYKLWLDVPGGPVVWRFTNWEHDLVRSDWSGVGYEEATYKGDVNALFQHDKISHAIDLSDDPVTIGSWIFQGNPLVRVVQRVLDVPLQIEIRRGDPANPNAAAVVYSGEVLEADNEGRRLSASTAVLGGLLDVKVPNFFFGPVCNYQFTGPGCNTNGSMDPADWTFAGTIVSQVGSDLTIAVTSNPPAAALVADYFAKAWLKSGDGDNFELRQIVRSEDLGGGQQKFKLKRPLRNVVVGAAVTFRPYCSGTRAECEVKFDNYINMGAHPHIGSRNLSVPSRDVNTPTGKK
ncbi:MAG: phage BR0599 family protein [Verrucomicrobia bacterium]|nr:phage BR0599 family protein [Verrucomicrobiota bacterium]